MEMVRLGVKPLLSDLPTLAWMGDERSPTYGAYALSMRLTDGKGETRSVDFIAYGIDKAGPAYLIGNPLMKAENVQLDLGTQSWRWGITGSSHIRLVDVEELKTYDEAPAFLGMVGLDADYDSYTVRILSAQEAPEVRVPDALNAYQDVFSAEAASILPSHRATDHKIKVQEGKEPPYGPLYNLSERELEVLRDYLKDALEKGWIQRSTSPAGAPILFVPKKDGTLRLCVDYRALNDVTIEDRCQIPLIGETLDRLRGASWYTSLDLKDAYHWIRVNAGDEWKTAFRTRYGHFEYLVMPFGLANAPATFQAYINRALAGLVDTICVVYLDDILIYTHSEDLEVHWCQAYRRRQSQDSPDRGTNRVTGCSGLGEHGIGADGPIRGASPGRTLPLPSLAIRVVTIETVLNHSVPL